MSVATKKIPEPITDPATTEIEDPSPKLRTNLDDSADIDVPLKIFGNLKNEVQRREVILVWQAFKLRLRSFSEAFNVKA